jgi:predicted methyltransferase
MAKGLSKSIAGLVGLIICGATWADTAADIPKSVLDALADPRRPAEQRELDTERQAARAVTFAQVTSGARVLDFMPGGGYFTRIFSDVVGPTGRVYAFLPSEQVAHCPAGEIAGTRSIESDPSYRNVTVLTQSLSKFSIPGKLDLIWTSRNYHDLHDSFLGPADVAALNGAFFRALKPGGIFLVIDHAAEPNSGLRDTETLHRIDPVRMKREIEAAGFVLESESDALRNPADDHRRSVFDPRIRGKTDQVMYLFRKPRHRIGSHGTR